MPEVTVCPSVHVHLFWHYLQEPHRCPQLQLPLIPLARRLSSNQHHVPALSPDANAGLYFCVSQQKSGRRHHVRNYPSRLQAK